MNRRLVFNFLGRIMVYFSGVFIVPIITAFAYRESVTPFLAAFAISLLIGIPFYLIKLESEFTRYKEGYAIVGLGWLLVSIVGAIPYLFYGVSFLDAFFEAMSGFTTTGATIFDNIESLPRSLLLWRSLTQWLGGMGIIVLFVAIFPSLAKKGESLLQAEVPGIKLIKIKPRLRDTALALYKIYLFFTILEITLLTALGMSFYDAVNHTFTTLSTGGFSTHSESIAYFKNPVIEGVIFIFMLIGGTNFTLLYFLFRGRFNILKDTEFRAYLLMIFVASLLISVINLKNFDILTSVRYSFFQTASIMTTTGYTTYDFDLWDDSARLLLLILMFIGGSSGSTGGGIKVVRIYLLSAYSILQILKSAEPRTARVVKYGDEIVDKNVFYNITAFFSLYILIFALSSLILSILGNDIITSISAVSATLNNVGPALGEVGASETYSSLNPIAKLVLIIDMWMGRLEVFTVLALFIPSFWRERW